MKTTKTILVAAALLVAPARAQNGGYGHFEGRQTHPVRLSADGGHLYALNTPGASLSVFAVGERDAPPLLIAEIPVGLEPVSLAEREGEIWVVNEVSDSVSIVSLEKRSVVAELEAGDEPADIVFADGRAFVTAARENRVLVFDAATREPVGEVQLDMLFPRALCADAAGGRVFVAAQMSGNRSTILPPDRAPPPPAPTNPELPPAPQTGLIVADDDPRIPYTVRDHDVAEIEVYSLEVARYLEGAGTHLFDLLPDPAGDALWVANTEALNLVRFEPALRGHFVDNRVTRLPLDGGAPSPVDLNPGAEYGSLPDAVSQRSSIAQPKALAFAPDGQLWVAGFGSDIVAELDPASGAVARRVDVGPQLAPGETSRPREKRGPRGLAIDAVGGRLFALNRLSNTLSVIDLATAEVSHEVAVGSFDPTPAEVREGRGFLFDARLSGNGTNSCASCHLDADRDGLAWDLGDPGGAMVEVEGENRVNHDTAGNDQPPVVETRLLHPMKGPKVTQTLRGMITRPHTFADTSAPGGVSTREPSFHWRGDRQTLEEFNATYDQLMGGTELADGDFAALVDYLESLRLHPNPYRELDRSLPAEVAGGDPVAGRANFLNHGLSHCIVCHPLPSGTDMNIDEFNNASTVDLVKTPPLLLSYQKQDTFTPTKESTLSGFGFGHDGTGRALPLPHFYFLSVMDVQQLIDTRAFIMAFDSISDGTAPAVGHGVMVDASNAVTAEVAAEIEILLARSDPALAAVNQYWNDVIATGHLAGELVDFVYDPGLDRWRADRSGGPLTTTPELLASVGAGEALVFRGVPVGLGARLSIDRDGDLLPDGDELPPVPTIRSVAGEVIVDWSSAEPGYFPELLRGAGPWRAQQGGIHVPPDRWQLSIPAEDNALLRLRGTR